MEGHILYEEIGRGPHSVVFKGRMQKTLEYVAIKQYEKSMKPRLNFEAALSQRLDHPNLMKIKGYFETSQNVWVVQDFVSAVSLHSVVVDDGPMPEDKAAPIIFQLLCALYCLHINGIVLGEFQAEQILLMEGGFNVQMWGFHHGGIINDNGEVFMPNTNDGVVEGEAVEAVQADDSMQVSVFHDLMSLGLLFFYLLTGERQRMDLFVKKTENPLKYRLKITSEVSEGAVDVLNLLATSGQFPAKDQDVGAFWGQILECPYWEPYLHTQKRKELDCKLPERTLLNLQKTLEVLPKISTGDAAMPMFVPAARNGASLTLNRRAKSYSNVPQHQRRSTGNLKNLERVTSFESGRLFNEYGSLTAPDSDDQQSKDELSGLIFFTTDFVSLPLVQGITESELRTKKAPPVVSFKIYNIERFGELSDAQRVTHLDSLATQTLRGPMPVRNFALRHFEVLSGTVAGANSIVGSSVYPWLIEKIRKPPAANLQKPVCRILAVVHATMSELKTNAPWSTSLEAILSVAGKGIGTNPEIRKYLLGAAAELLYFIYSLPSPEPDVYLESEEGDYIAQSWDVLWTTFTEEDWNDDSGLVQLTGQFFENVASFEYAVTKVFNEYKWIPEILRLALVQSPERTGKNDVAMSMLGKLSKFYPSLAAEFMSHGSCHTLLYTIKTAKSYTQSVFLNLCNMALITDKASMIDRGQDFLRDVMDWCMDLCHIERRQIVLSSRTFPKAMICLSLLCDVDMSILNVCLQPSETVTAGQPIRDEDDDSLVAILENAIRDTYYTNVKIQKGSQSYVLASATASYRFLLSIVIEALLGMRPSIPVQDISLKIRQLTVFAKRRTFQRDLVAPSGMDMMRDMIGIVQERLRKESPNNRLTVRTLQVRGMVPRFAELVADLLEYVCTCLCDPWTLLNNAETILWQIFPLIMDVFDRCDNNMRIGCLELLDKCLWYFHRLSIDSSSGLGSLQNTAGEAVAKRTMQMKIHRSLEIFYKSEICPRFKSMLDMLSIGSADIGTRAGSSKAVFLSLILRLVEACDGPGIMDAQAGDSLAASPSLSRMNEFEDLAPRQLDLESSRHSSSARPALIRGGHSMAPTKNSRYDLFILGAAMLPDSKLDVNRGQLLYPAATLRRFMRLILVQEQEEDALDAHLELFSYAMSTRFLHGMEYAMQTESNHLLTDLLGIVTNLAEQKVLQVHNRRSMGSGSDNDPTGVSGRRTPIKRLDSRRSDPSLNVHWANSGADSGGGTEISVFQPFLDNVQLLVSATGNCAPDICIAALKLLHALAGLNPSVSETIGTISNIRSLLRVLPKRRSMSDEDGRMLVDAVMGVLLLIVPRLVDDKVSGSAKARQPLLEVIGKEIADGRLEREEFSDELQTLYSILGSQRDRLRSTNV
eukprot:Clim_evm211s157 gene=Clim_evmTU211s157